MFQLQRGYKKFLLHDSIVRMAERSKAPDSRAKTLSSNGAFWSTNVGVGSNPTSDKVFLLTSYNFSECSSAIKETVWDIFILDH